MSYLISTKNFIVHTVSVNSGSLTAGVCIDIEQEKGLQMPIEKFSNPCQLQPKSPLISISRKVIIMWTGLVRAAFCTLKTETIDLSERNKKARNSVSLFLDQIADESARKNFDKLQFCSV